MTTSPGARIVRIAAVLFIAYGMMVVVNATVLQMLGGWQDAADYPRALARCAGVAAIAWGLWKTMRWAWWLATLLGGLWAFFAAGVLLLTFVIPMPGLVLEPREWIGALLTLILLGAAVVLLLSRDGRAAFRLASPGERRP